MFMNAVAKNVIYNYTSDMIFMTQYLTSNVIYMYSLMVSSLPGPMKNSSACMYLSNNQIQEASVVQGFISTVLLLTSQVIVIDLPKYSTINLLYSFHFPLKQDVTGLA